MESGTNYYRFYYNLLDGIHWVFVHSGLPIRPILGVIVILAIGFGILRFYNANKIGG